jgi:Tol biopolymer transport system component
MKAKLIFLLIIAFLLTACGGGTAAPAPVTQTPAATQPPTDIPTQTAIPTFIPLGPTSLPSPTAMPPYPTASVVKSNAVAFIGRDNSNSLDTSLWVANVDGSGERKLVDIAYNRQDGDWGITSYYLQWSPDGKWISYIEAHALWIISPDGSVKRRLFPLPDTRGTFLYRWSLDSLKIAYLEFSPDKSTVTPTPGPDNGMAPYLVGVIDIATGNVSELFSFEANAGIPILLWSPNGRDLLFIKDYSLVLLEVATHKIVKTIKRGCGLERGLSWSPNGRWFSYTDNGVGGFNPTWICVNSATGGSIQTIHVDSTSFNPVWDKTGNYLYFLATKINLARKPDSPIDERLMRYDARTQKTESLLSLKEQQQPDSYTRFFSLSPDGNTLMLQSESSQTKFDLIFVDVQSLATTKYTVDFEELKVPFLYSYILETAWSPDNQNLILFAGDFCTPSGCGGWGPRGYGSFYALNIKTGKVSIFSGEHSIYSWQVSPIATTP